MQLAIFIVLVTSCLTFLTRAETQSVDSASSQNGASLVHTSRQQQQQQQLSTRPLHSATNEYALKDARVVNSSSAYQSSIPNQSKNNWLDFIKTPDLVSADKFLKDISSSHPETDGYSQPFRSGIFNSGGTDNKAHPPSQTDWGRLQFRYKNEMFQNNYNTPFSTEGSADNTKMIHEGHRMYKRETPSFETTNGQVDSYFLDDSIPVVVDRRYQMYRPGNAAYPAPYLSAQEFKETFRRSDPYFMGKRTLNFLPEEEEKRDAPKFVGRRDPPYFVGKRESISFSDNNLADIISEEDESSLLEDKRAAPKFVGRRGAPYFVGKRAPPKFVGKRDNVFQNTDDSFLSLDDKRAAPKFVGRRGAPYFVGKRDPSIAWDLLSSEDVNQLLEDKRLAPKFVGKRGAPYFVGKRDSTKLGAKHVFEFEDGEPSFLDNRREAARILGRRGSPYFVGKRASPKFVGKRWAEIEYHLPSDTDDKRAAPKFVGRRGSPYFVGKREQSEPTENQFYEFDSFDEELPLEESKRAAPKFVGRRGAPYFVGKRGPPKFVGKRSVTDEWLGQNNLLVEDKRAAPKFIGRRGAPYFVGKRRAPVFVGKRDELHGDSGSEALLQKTAENYILSGKDSSDSFSAIGKLENASRKVQELESLAHLQAIESLKAGTLGRIHHETNGTGGQQTEQTHDNTEADETREQR